MTLAPPQSHEENIAIALRLPHFTPVQPFTLHCIQALILLRSSRLAERILFGQPFPFRERIPNENLSDASDRVKRVCSSQDLRVGPSTIRKAPVLAIVNPFQTRADLLAAS